MQYVANGVIRPAVACRIGVAAVVQKIGKPLDAYTFFGIFIENQTDNCSVFLIDFQIIKLVLALVQSAAFDKLVTERRAAALVVTFLNHLTEACPGTDGGLFALAVSLPKSDIVEQLIDMIIKTLFAIYDWRLMIACLWGVPVAFLLLFGSRKLAKKQSEISKKAAVTVSDGIQETLENIREIRAANQEERYLDGLNQKIDAHEKTLLKGELSTGIFVNAASVIMRLGVATTILTGAGLILSGEINFMVFFLFLLVITRVYAPFDQSLALIAEMFMSQVSANRLMEIYDTPTAKGADEFTPDGHDIVFENVGFAYDNEQVLKGVSFTAKEGEVTALVGPSGSGKSTCARLSARLWDITEGSIKVGGVDINTIEPETLLTDYSMVFQDVVLFDDTVMENIRLGKHGATDEEVRAAAKAANCDEFVEKLPQGYDTPIGENGAKLSGGERQRISIARALLKNAPIVLLDEATASLDVENETKVQGALSTLLQNKTVLVIAHRMRTVQAANHIIVLKDGKVAESGKPEDLLQQNGEFAKMVRLQQQSSGWTVA